MTKKKPLHSARLVSALLALVMILGCFLTGCGKEEEPTATGGLKENLGNRDNTEATGETTPGETETTAAQEESWPDSGWYVSTGGDAYLFENGTACTGFYYNENNTVCGDMAFAAGWYYFDEAGIMQKNTVVEVDGYAHYFLESGVAAAPGWYCDDRGWYHLDDMGQLSRDTDIQGEGYHCWVGEDGYLSELRYDVLTGTAETGPAGMGKNRTYTVLDQAVTGCVQFSIPVRGDHNTETGGARSWNLWLRIDGEWVDMEDLYTSTVSDGKVIITFQAPVAFDAFYRDSIMGLSNQQLELQDVVICY